jgi:hypothetical protein
VWEEVGLSTRKGVVPKESMRGVTASEDGDDEMPNSCYQREMDTSGNREEGST